MNNCQERYILPSELRLATSHTGGAKDLSIGAAILSTLWVGGLRSEQADYPVPAFCPQTFIL
jgi:hypothetical protein